MLQSLWLPLVMSLEKFQAISHFLHFADNSAAPSNDDPTYAPLCKIRSVIEAVQYEAQKGT